MFHKTVLDGMIIPVSGLIRCRPLASLEIQWSKQEASFPFIQRGEASGLTFQLKGSKKNMGKLSLYF